MRRPGTVIDKTLDRTRADGRPSIMTCGAQTWIVRFHGGPRSPAATPPVKTVRAEERVFCCWYNGRPLRPLRSIAVLCALAAVIGSARPAGAQDPPPIPRFVVDLHGTVATFPADANLAFSRGLDVSELPG